MKRSVPARLLGAFTNVLLLVAFSFGALLFVPSLLGMHHYVILTGSMTGTYDRGSIIFDRPVPTKQLHIGDPITYSPPPGQTAHSQVTHRINRLRHGQDGLRIYGTKGDANRVQDPWTFQLPQPTQDKVVFHVPYAGYALGVLSDRHYRMYLIGIPALLVALGVIRGLFRDPSEAQRSEAPGWGGGHISEPTHPAHAPTVDLTDVAAIFVALGDGVRAGSERRRVAARRPVEARGPRIARLLVPDGEPPTARRRDAVPGYVALPAGEPARAQRRRPGRRAASARGPRVPQLSLPHLH
jgi:signal peptidase